MQEKQNFEEWLSQFPYHTQLDCWWYGETLINRENMLHIFLEQLK